MAETRKIVKVFLASPGDLPEERVAANTAVNEFNALMADDLGYQVELVGWEDTVSVYGRPQATINVELGRCELFIGMMWKKWGTPPDTDGDYSSGFEEEFDLSVQRRVAEGKPEISLFFKGIDQEFLVDPGEDLKKVIAFKEKLINEKKILYEQFSDARELEKKITRCIWTYVSKLRKQDAEYISAKSQSPAVHEQEPTQEELPGISSNTPLSKEGVKFLRGFISRTESASSDEAEEVIGALDIARFRLLSNILKRRENDDRALGVHDSNLLFQERTKTRFGGAEVQELISTGLRNLKDENTPLWNWVSELDGFNKQIFLSFTVVGAKKVRLGAIEAMRLIGAELPANSRVYFLDVWLSVETDSDLIVSALKYLGEFGVVPDESAIRTEFDKSNNKTAGPAAEAMVRIRLREGRVQAVRTLYVLQPASIDKSLLHEIFGNPHGIPTDVLMDGIGHLNADIRLPIVKELRVRGEITPALAEKLSTDSDANVRYEALMTLVESGAQYSIADAKGILTKPTKANETRPGLFSFWSFGASRDVDADNNLRRFGEYRIRAFKEKELREMLVEDTIFEHAAWFVLAERHPHEFGQVLRDRVDDEWKQTFSAGMENLIEKLGPGNESIEKTRDLEEFTRKKLTRRALDLICAQGKVADLARVRSALRSGFLDYSNADVEYIRKYGEWDDVPLLIESAKRPGAYDADSVAASLLGRTTDKHKDALVARAVLDLGRHRFGDIVAMPMDPDLLIQILKITSDKSLKSLNDVALLSLLRSKSDTVRKVIAIRCIRALSKRRAVQLLTAYSETSEAYYYNVVYWLDFHISTPREMAVRAADRLLKAM